MQQLLILFFGLWATIAFAEEQLIFSIDLIRHGDRTATCELSKSSLEPQQGLGELTERGREQELVLGKELRKFYVKKTDLLPPHYNPETMKVRSTGTNRTIESAKYLLSGLYPDAEDIPIQSENVNTDQLLMVAPGSTAFKFLQEHFVATHQWDEKMKPYSKKLIRWREQSGLPLVNLADIVCLYDNLFVRQQHNLPLPKGLTEEDSEEILRFGDKLLVDGFNEYDFPMGKRYLKNADTYFQEAKNPKSSLRYLLYVAHDSTILSVMHALGVKIVHMPPYASRLNFSLYSNEGKYQVKITFNNAKLKIPQCHGTLCSEEEFQVLAH